MIAMLRGMLCLAMVTLLAACMPTRTEVRIAQREVRALQDTRLTCDRADHCARDSALYDLARQALVESRPEAPSHRLILLESGLDALLARIALIRAARERIDVQSFIYAQDDSGFFVLQELLAAARRGVKVRVLLDQLYSVDDVELVSALARSHVNFELRLYNPTFGKARTGPLEFAAGVLCCFTRFNQRMHNKLLLADGVIGITGGRNYQDRYFDWDPTFNYRDRDIVVAGPAAAQMRESFDTFWRHPRAVPVAALHDVRRRLRRAEGPAQIVAKPPLRVQWLSAQADDPSVIEARLVQRAHAVSAVEFVSDLPNKALERNHPSERDLSAELLGLFNSAQERILLQTPYLVFSRTAQRNFRQLQERTEPPRIVVSTNSLAATDAFPVYALSHKYKRRYLREFGLHIYEYKPFPGDAPFDPGIVPIDPGIRSATTLGEKATESRRAFGSGAQGSRGSALSGRVPLERSGIRMGMHAKSMVIDERIALVGTHNFDPRSDRLNTESAVVVHDAAFARLLAGEILADTAPENAWVIAPRPRPPVLSGLNYSLGKAFEALPLFDIWPFRYATSWEMKPGCAPVPRDDPAFAECYAPVGDFPEVDVPSKSIYTRVLTAFGAGLAPIL
ncbi:phospholipase D family protein [Xanthomonadaceae bacterium JHOS43]|nr:phospholipase D family protein [Xanthomonadaceae bacterium JHOS43]MCX7561985.1 phospholipase D family protein [Xanthomonadaceae bacterium XH05]